MAFCALPAATCGQVAEIAVEFAGGAPNAQFDGSVLTVHDDSGLGLVSVWEDGPLSGFTNVQFSLTAEFDGVGVYGGSLRGAFRNGLATLSFSDPSRTYSLSSELDLLLVAIVESVSGPTSFTRLDVEARMVWPPLLADLPLNPTGIWPAPGGMMSPGNTLSSLDSILLDVALPNDPSSPDYHWSSLSPWADGVSEGWLFESHFPEPATAVLLGTASVVLIRRRRCAER